jgi:hypothetical protein
MPNSFKIEEQGIKISEDLVITVRETKNDDLKQFWNNHGRHYQGIVNKKSNFMALTMFRTRKRSWTKES